MIAKLIQHAKSHKVEKNYMMIISIDREETLDQIQHRFMIKMKKKMMMMVLGLLSSYLFSVMAGPSSPV